ncbi:MFS transporter [Ktedonospora formicarum]|uniref:MFS transporter n=1 Tax=Ktedonospora formicarum TaxID=2778364 RepID=A0A8J3IBI4_9CHLR|nr:MFS transporter [Ktedonospora formicarum]GHO50903.1 MFS transporter [Ktedonospora formicarum]
MTDAPLSSSPSGEDPKASEEALLGSVDTMQAITLNTLTFPGARVTVGYRIAFTLASAVGGLSSVCIKQLLLPIQVSALDPVSTNTSFALVASIGALAGLIASPLSGALSDRTTLRWGRRRPWICGGVLVAACGLLIMARATSIPLLLFGEILAQIGVDTVLSCVTAILADQVPPARRPLLSALNGMAPIVGGILGLVAVTLFTQTSDIALGYVLLAGASVCCTFPFVFMIREAPLDREARPPFHLLTFIAGFVAPLRSRDFALTVLSRCLVFLSFTLLGAYLLFFLCARLGFSLAEAKVGVTLFQALSTALVLPISVLGGMLAHRVQRLKPFVIVGVLVMAAGLLIIACVPLWGAILCAAAVFGCGWGLFLGVDIALAIAVLPDTAGSGKDLGVLYTSIFLPLLLSPIIGATVLNTTGNNYTLLFLLAALASVLAAGTMLPIRSVR